MQLGGWSPRAASQPATEGRSQPRWARWQTPQTPQLGQGSAGRNGSSGSNDSADSGEPVTKPVESGYAIAAVYYRLCAHHCFEMRHLTIIPALRTPPNTTPLLLPLDLLQHDRAAAQNHSQQPLAAMPQLTMTSTTHQPTQGALGTHNQMRSLDHCQQ